MGMIDEVRVLVVDYEPVVLVMVAAVLKNAGLGVETARSGTEALTIIRERPDAVSVLLTNVMMPDVDGFQLTEQAREILPDLPVIFMTGVKGIASIYGPVLEKPFRPSDLVHTIHRLATSRKEPGREVASADRPAAGQRG